jgi:hypothetical protein
MRVCKQFVRIAPVSHKYLDKIVLEDKCAFPVFEEGAGFVQGTAKGGRAEDSGVAGHCVVFVSKCELRAWQWKWSKATQQRRKGDAVAMVGLEILLRSGKRRAP